MIAFVLFGAAIFAIIFFIIGIGIKALAAAFDALILSLESTCIIGGFAAMVGIVLYLIYSILDEIAQSGFTSAIKSIIFLVVMLGIFWGLVGDLGTLLLNIIEIFALGILNVIKNILEWMADACECAYIKFLTIIMKHIDKC